jgi:hypothetical protein
MITKKCLHSLIQKKLVPGAMVPPRHPKYVLCVIPMDASRDAQPIRCDFIFGRTIIYLAAPSNSDFHVPIWRREVNATGLKLDTYYI